MGMDDNDIEQDMILRMLWDEIQSRCESELTYLNFHQVKQFFYGTFGLNPIDIDLDPATVNNKVPYEHYCSEILKIGHEAGELFESPAECAEHMLLNIKSFILEVAPKAPTIKKPIAKKKVFVPDLTKKQIRERDTLRMSTSDLLADAHAYEAKLGISQSLQDLRSTCADTPEELIKKSRKRSALLSLHAAPNNKSEDMSKVLDIKVKVQANLDPMTYDAENARSKILQEKLQRRKLNASRHLGHSLREPLREDGEIDRFRHEIAIKKSKEKAIDQAKVTKEKDTFLRVVVCSSCEATKASFWCGPCCLVFCEKCWETRHGCSVPKELMPTALSELALERKALEAAKIASIKVGTILKQEETGETNTRRLRLGRAFESSEQELRKLAEPSLHLQAKGMHPHQAHLKALPTKIEPPRSEAMRLAMEQLQLEKRRVYTGPPNRVAMKIPAVIMDSTSTFG